MMDDGYQPLYRRPQISSVAGTWLDFLGLRIDPVSPCEHTVLPSNKQTVVSRVAHLLLWTRTYRVDGLNNNRVCRL